MEIDPTRLRINEIPLFASLPQDRRRALKRRLTISRFAAGDRVLDEGAKNPGRLYVVIEGEAPLCNKGRLGRNLVPGRASLFKQCNGENAADTRYLLIRPGLGALAGQPVRGKQDSIIFDTPISQFQGTGLMKQLQPETIAAQAGGFI